MNGRRKFLLRIALAATVTMLSAIVLGSGIEWWVRASWNETNGSPGFYLADAARGQRLAANYRGWFAGVPVATNALGFRDEREYQLDKGRNVFRIVILGDSVTFGHGALFDTTYPFLLEQHLRKWRPEVNWQVWNLGVPGYNTSQELAYLLEVGQRYRPDLVVVGFYPNDFTDNEPIVLPPSWFRRARAAAQRQLQTHLYSYEFYKRAYLTLRWKLLMNDSYGQRLEHLVTEERLLAPGSDNSVRPEQRLTETAYFDDNDVKGFRCIGVPPADLSGVEELRAMESNPTPAQRAWFEAVRQFQALDRSGHYRIVFFVNMAPEVCVDQNRFYDAGSVAYSDYLRTLLGEENSTSSVRAFLHYRPSEMPMASGHSIGNSNEVKADVLFDFLRARLPAASGTDASSPP